jgi:hypothetical protein
MAAGGPEGDVGACFPDGLTDDNSPPVELTEQQVQACNADSNGNGAVDVHDILAVLSLFNVNFDPAICP